MGLGVTEAARRQLADALFARVAGPEGPARRERIRAAEGERWFAADRPIRAVHGDASMFVGGIRALLLQSLHPLAMAGVAAHSAFEHDPWGRLQRTSHFLAVTTFGAADDAEAAVARVRRIHERVRGTTPDGRPYAASDPHLLGWVHVAEVDSFLRAHRAYGAQPLDDTAYDDYVADAASVAEALGVVDPPRTVAALDRAIASYRAELAGTREARAAARFLLLRPPVPLVARPTVGVLGAAAVGLLPLWARWPLRLPWLPVTERVAVRVAATAVTKAIRWAMTPAADTA
jgi:uncharacterized protein (DUF2236 family)